MDKVEEFARIGEVLRERYEVLRELGQGAQGVTYLAEDRTLGGQVAIKELHLGRVNDWKMIELFEREGLVLEGLSHPQIPAYVDSFRLEESGEVGFFLVQEFVAGQSLEALIADGLRMDEGQVRGFIGEILGVLEYLHGLSPPVVHRDIKPSNIMRRAADKRWVLIDFGAVQRVESVGARGLSTIVGTSGYMPLEQLMGRAVPATDLYGLGATVVHLLSHRHPMDLPVDGLKLDFGAFVNVSQSLRKFLEGMLEPYVEERISSAVAARGVLERGVLEPGVVENGAVQIAAQPAAVERALKPVELQFGAAVVWEDPLEIKAGWEAERRMLETHAAERRELVRVEPDVESLIAQNADTFRGSLEKTETGVLVKLPGKVFDLHEETLYFWLAVFALGMILVSQENKLSLLGNLMVVVGSSLPLVLMLGRMGWGAMLREEVEIGRGLLRYEMLRRGRSVERVDLPLSSITSVELVSRRDLREEGWILKRIVDHGLMEEVVVRTELGTEVCLGGDLFHQEVRVLHSVLAAAAAVGGGPKSTIASRTRPAWPN